MNVAAEEERVYAESQGSHCPKTCTEGKVCACDVILMTHSCQGEGKNEYISFTNKISLGSLSHKLLSIILGYDPQGLYS